MERNARAGTSRARGDVMMTSDDDGWVDKSGAEGRVDETRRREETRRSTEGADAKTTGSGKENVHV